MWEEMSWGAEPHQGCWTGLPMHEREWRGQMAVVRRATHDPSRGAAPWSVAIPEELHFPEAPASRCSQMTGSQSISDAGGKAGLYRRGEAP